MAIIITLLLSLGVISSVEQATPEILEAHSNVVIQDMDEM